MFVKTAYEEMSPPHSYINTLDFKSPKELAIYLKYLISNTTAYYEYFKWTDYFSVHQDRNRVMCEICEKLNEVPPSQQKVYKDIKHWWKEKGNCNGISRAVRFLNPGVMIVIDYLFLFLFSLLNSQNVGVLIM